jgi:hypothetical protein
MAGSFRAPLAKVFQLIERQIVAGEMQQRVKQHRAVTGRQQKSDRDSPTSDSAGCVAESESTAHRPSAPRPAASRDDPIQPFARRRAKRANCVDAKLIEVGSWCDVFLLHWCAHFNQARALRTRFATLTIDLTFSDSVNHCNSPPPSDSAPPTTTRADSLDNSTTRVRVRRGLTAKHHSHRAGCADHQCDLVFRTTTGADVVRSAIADDRDESRFRQCGPARCERFESRAPVCVLISGSVSARDAEIANKSQSQSHAR